MPRRPLDPDAPSVPPKKEPVRDNAWNFVYKNDPRELAHDYGSNVHVLNDPLLLSLIARAGFPGTEQHIVRQAIGAFYRHAIHYAATEFQTMKGNVPTNMRHYTEHGVYRGPLPVLDDVVLVSIERGGAKPTQDLADYLSLISGGSVRIDSVTAERQTNDQGEVIGCKLSAAKIGGHIQGKTVLIPDPMGATGFTLRDTRDGYRGKIPLNGRTQDYGKPRVMIALHMIVAPEYLRLMKEECPEVVVFAGRVDRGLSPPHVFNTYLGQRWDEERGLNEHQYIVPGAGGIGELLSGEVQQKAFHAH